MALQVIQQLHLGSLTFHSRLALLHTQVALWNSSIPKDKWKLIKSFWDQSAGTCSGASLLQSVTWEPAICMASRSRTTGSSTGGASKKPAGHLQQTLDDHRNSWSEGLWDLPYLWSRWTRIWNLHPSKLCTSKDTMPGRPPWDGLEF